MAINKTAKETAREALRESERLRAEIYRLTAFLEYTAMMADVDLPEEEDAKDE